MSGRKPNGNGSIFFDEKRNKWCAEIQWSDKNGERYRKKFSALKKTVVKNKLEEFKKQLLISDGNIENKGITFEEFAENWLTTVVKHKLKPSSYTRKEVTLINQVYPHIGNIPIDRITHSDVQNMINSLNDKGLSYSTIKKAYEAVNSCLKEYRIRTTTPFNPCEGVSLPTSAKKGTSDIKFFNEKQRELIKAEATRKYSNGKPVYRLGYAIILLMYTGLRIGELLALKWTDVDFENRTVDINKNAVIVKTHDNSGDHYTLVNQPSTKTASGRRTIPLNQTSLNALLEIYKINGDKEYVMSSSNNRQITPRNINRLFHSILTQTKIAEDNNLCGVHTLRHTFASMLFQNGCDVKIVSELLGHSDTKITENIYIHVIQQQKVKAIQDIDKYSD